MQKFLFFSFHLLLSNCFEIWFDLITFIFYIMPQDSWIYGDHDGLDLLLVEEQLVLVLQLAKLIVYDWLGFVWGGYRYFIAGGLFVKFYVGVFWVFEYLRWVYNFFYLLFQRFFFILFHNDLMYQPVDPVSNLTCTCISRTIQKPKSINIMINFIFIFIHKIFSLLIFLVS